MSGVLRQYVCNLYKELQIGRKIKFQNGFFETEDPVLQAQIETTNGFGVNIHYKDSIEEMEHLGRERQEQAGAEHARKRKQFLEEIEAEEKAANWQEAKKEKVEKATKEKAAISRRLKTADRVL